MRIEGKVTEDNEILVKGCICKGNKRIHARFKVDTGFTRYDVAIPSNMADKLSLNPSKVEQFSTAAGTVTLHIGDDAVLCLSGKTFRVTYVVHFGRHPLLSADFLKRISEVMVVDFVRGATVIVLK